MMIKICGITNRDDAMAAVEAGASAIGFNFYRNSPRYISPTGAAMIAAKIPSSVLKVGVFVDEPTETVAKVALDAGLDVAQLHGLSEARGMRIWRALPANAPIPEELPAGTEAILIDTPSADLPGGTGQTWDWKRVKGHPWKLIIAGGLDASNVAQAIKEAQPWGVDACSRLEKSPGVKDQEKMRNFIKAARGE
jgi:phosphoribosylanthranilate isomerase